MLGNVVKLGGGGIPTHAKAPPFSYKSHLQHSSCFPDFARCCCCCCCYFKQDAVTVFCLLDVKISSFSGENHKETRYLLQLWWTWGLCLPVRSQWHQSDIINWALLHTHSPLGCPASLRVQRFALPWRHSCVHITVNKRVNHWKVLVDYW